MLKNTGETKMVKLIKEKMSIVNLTHSEVAILNSAMDDKIESAEKFLAAARVKSSEHTVVNAILNLKYLRSIKAKVISPVLQEVK
jgi:hypothetical protein